MKPLYKILVLFLIIIGCQTDWLSDIKKIVDNTDANAILIDTNKIADKDGTTTTLLFEFGDTNKIKQVWDYGELMSMEINFYEKGGVIFGEIINGKSPTLYKRTPKEDDPIGTLMDSKIYFKSETEGVKMARQLSIYKSDDLEVLKEKILEMEFETTQLDAKDYQESKRKFDHINIE